MRTTALVAALAGLLAGLAPPAVAAPPDGQLKVAQRIPGPDGGWDYASFDAARRRAYFSHGTVVLSLDVDSGKLDAAFAPGDHLHAIVAVPGSEDLVTTNSGDNSVRIIKASDGSLVKSLTVAEDADGAVYDPTTGLVAVVNGDPGLITLIDVAKREVAGEIKVGDKLEFAAIGEKGRLYVNVASTGEVAVVDLAARKAVGRYAMADCKRPTGIAYVEGDRIVSACGSGVAKILDAASGKELASFKIGGFPDSVLYDPKRHLAMIPTALDGNLWVISLAGKDDNTLVQTVPTQIGARTGAVDPKTGRVYLPTAEYNLPVPPGQRPTTKPGTFQILVLDRQ
jgi:DNA-binding beta-propeller fold protein YncE